MPLWKEPGSGFPRYPWGCVGVGEVGGLPPPPGAGVVGELPPPLGGRGVGAAGLPGVSSSSPDTDTVTGTEAVPP